MTLVATSTFATLPGAYKNLIKDDKFVTLHNRHSESSGLSNSLSLQVLADSCQYQQHLVTDETDVATVRDFMHLRNFIDDAPSTDGGKQNWWRKLNLEEIPRQTVGNRLKRTQTHIQSHTQSHTRTRTHTIFCS